MLEDRGRGAGNQVDERLEVAVGAERHIDQAFRFDLGADIGAVRLQYGGRCCYGYGFRHIARNKSEVDASGRVAGKADVLLQGLFESLCFDGHRVDAGLQARKGVVAAFVSRRLMNGAGCRVGCRDSSIGDGCASGVGHSSKQRPVNCLPL